MSRALLAFLLSSLSLVSCGVSRPSESDAQALVASKLSSGARIATFKKLNGQDVDAGGRKGYRMQYEAIIETTCPGTTGCIDYTGKHVKAGGVWQFKQAGYASFEKSEKGWVNGTLEESN